MYHKNATRIFPAMVKYNKKALVLETIFKKLNTSKHPNKAQM